MTSARCAAGRFRPALLLAVGALFALAFANARANLLARGIPTSFAFLNQVAGFSLNQSVIPFSPLSSYGRALLVGLLNTLAGFGARGGVRHASSVSPRASRGCRAIWALARLAGLYVETMRNLPLLLQILFWYVAILVAVAGAGELVSFRRLFPEQSRS